jgi:nitroimidazol reductase NimA-like FMN-containing flavoprotein (pyridoxamine 5'-phosphate oxidase superfamily)
MRTTTPAELDRRYSSPGATATAWEDARGRLAEAGLYFLATVRPEGGPHVTPLLSVFVDDRAWFSTGPHERKAGNLARNPRCALIAGSASPDEGLDVVIEGEAVRETDEEVLQRVADAYVAKYGGVWRFRVRDGAFHHPGSDAHEAAEGTALVFRIEPSKGFGFGKGEVYSQTRWRFG